MSITLTNGVVLPDIPSDVLASYPYVTITHVIGSNSDFYQLLASASEIVHSPQTVTPGWGVDVIVSDTASFSAYGSQDGLDEWIVLSVEAAYVYEGEFGGMTYELIWSNHDIMSIVAIEDETYTVGTEIYFPSSVKSNFILPDGTELPALPEGCFEKYPYGMISYVESTDVEAAYALSVAEGTYIFAPGSATGEGSDYVISLLPGYRHYRYVVAPTAASGWEQYAESTTQHSGHDFSREDGTIEICWCNHDILTATAMNDDGTPEIGPDLYRKSDVNYRIYGGWLNSMGNQARRLGGVSGALKPGEMETVFKGVTLDVTSAEGMVF